MSWQACQYARELLEHDDELTRSARLVLMLCAERADRLDAQTYTGEWLERAAKLHRSSVRRSLYELVDAGAIALQHRPGRASIVRFPLAGALSTPGAPARGVVDVDLARQRALPGAPARATRRGTAPRTGHVPVYVPPAALCVAAGCGCEGSGWVRIDDGAGVGYVAPCPGRDRAPDGARAPKAATG